MSPEELPPPETEACLDRPCPSSQKGGTVIAETVTDRQEHERRVSDPQGYRLEQCLRCGSPVLHRHQYRERRLKAEEPEALRIVVQRCAAAGCRATFRMLPAFAARWLRYSWQMVEQHTLGERRVVPERTARRWRLRLRTSARLAVVVLGATLVPGLVRVAQQVGLLGTKQSLVAACTAAREERSGRQLSAPAALLHRLCPGVRLM